jgi:hypothetical protein
VEASTNGKTWATLRSTDTTAANPNGGSYGNGFTGASKGWKTESVDLSAYAGRRVQIRFQYITDDEYNGQGMVIRSIRVPEIGFRDRYAGWASRGFIAVRQNDLVNTWHVQVIAYTGSGVKVSTFPLHHASGTLTVDPAHDGPQKLVLAVYSTAPKTTVSSEYQLSADR